MVGAAVAVAIAEEGGPAGPQVEIVSGIARKILPADGRDAEQDAIAAHVAGTVEHGVEDSGFFAGAGLAAEHTNDSIRLLDIGGGLKCGRSAIGFAVIIAGISGDFQTFVIVDGFAATQQSRRADEKQKEGFHTTRFEVTRYNVKRIVYGTGNALWDSYPIFPPVYRFMDKAMRNVVKNLTPPERLAFAARLERLAHEVRVCDFAELSERCRRLRLRRRHPPWQN